MFSQYEKNGYEMVPLCDGEGGIAPLEEAPKIPLLTLAIFQQLCFQSENYTSFTKDENKVLVSQLSHYVTVCEKETINDLDLDALRREVVRFRILVGEAERESFFGLGNEIIHPMMPLFLLILLVNAAMQEKTFDPENFNNIKGEILKRSTLAISSLSLTTWRDSIDVWNDRAGPKQKLKEAFTELTRISLTFNSDKQGGLSQVPSKEGGLRRRNV